MHTHDQESILISTLEEGHTVTAACKRAGVTRQMFYRLSRAKPAFRKRVEEARTAGSETNMDLIITMYYKKVREGHWPALHYALKKQDNKKDEDSNEKISQDDIRSIINGLPEPYKAKHYAYLQELLEHLVEFQNTGKIDPPRPDDL
jgi:hypothetical protein